MEPHSSIEGRTPCAEERKAQYTTIGGVEDRVEEEVIFHELPCGEDGMSSVRIENEKSSIGAEVRYSSGTLPILSQWKFRLPGEYVLGIEPGNSHIEGREEALRKGGLPAILPGEKKRFLLTLRLFELPE